MSSSGNAVGIRRAYIRDAQDVTLQRRRRLVFQEGLANHIPNGNERYLTSLLGAKECIELSCPGISDTLTVLRYNSYKGDRFDWDDVTFIRNPDLVEYSYTGDLSSVISQVPYDTNLTDVILGVGVTSICPGAFFSCIFLKTITIPNSVETIGIDAFNDCRLLETITIPNSVETISAGTFYACFSLETVILGNSVQSIEMDAFSYCASLTTIRIPASVTSIDSPAFENSGLENVYIANGQLGIDSPSGARNVSFFGATVETFLP
jgi:hypothetical protein